MLPRDGVQAGQQQMCGREPRMQVQQRLDPDDGVTRLPAEVENAGNAHLALGPRGIQPQHALEHGTGLIQRPFVEASLRQHEQERDIVGRNCHGLTKRIEF